MKWITVRHFVSERGWGLGSVTAQHPPRLLLVSSICLTMLRLESTQCLLCFINRQIRCEAATCHLRTPDPTSPTSRSYVSENLRSGLFADTIPGSLELDISFSPSHSQSVSIYHPPSSVNQGLVECSPPGPTCAKPVTALLFTTPLHGNAVFCF